MFKILSFLFINLYICVSAIDNDADIKFDHLTIEDGLGNSTVKHILQDNHGFIWFAALNTLSRYDGYEFITYKHHPKDPYSISGDRINALIECNDGDLIIGTLQLGIDVFDIESRMVYHYKNNTKDKYSIGSNQVNAIYEDKLNRIWIGTENILNLFNKSTGKFTRYYLPDDDLNIVSLIEYIDDEIWISTSNLKTFSFVIADSAFKELNIIPVSQQTPHIWRSKFYKDSKNALWISTVNNGLYRYDLKTGTTENFRNNPNDPSSLNNNDVYDITEDENHHFWVITDGGGLNHFDYENKIFTAYLNNPTNNNSISNNKLICILKDSSGILWLGSSNGGVSYYDKSKEKFRSFKNNPLDKNSLNHNIVWSFLEDYDGDILIGTDRGGLNIYNPDKYGDKFIHLTKTNGSGIPSNTIITIHQDRKGIIWLGTYNDGLIRFDKKNNKYTVYLSRKDEQYNSKFIAGNDVWDIEEDSLGNLWIATLRYGIDVFNPEKEIFKHYNIENSNLSNNNATTIYRDSRNRIWVGTTNGLNLYDCINDQFKVFQNMPNDTTGLPGNNIRVIFEDKNRDIWIGTEGFGICYMNGLDFSCTNFSENEGLPSNIVYGILEDESGNLWISTSKGLSKMNVAKASFKNFNVKEGLQSIEFKQNSCLKTKDGTMFFGGINGFNVFKPSEIKINSVKPPVYVTEFSIFNKPVYPYQNNNILSEDISLTNEIFLSYKDNLFTFKFSALNYTIPEKNEYAYMMEGFDNQWNKIGNKREATYTNLDPGKYIFKVIASNNDQIWNEKGVSIIVNIKPPWYETIIFKIFLVIFVITCILTFNFIRIKTIKKQKNVLEIEVKKRTKELNDAIENLKFSRDEIIAQNEEIQQQTEEIVTQRDELQNNKEKLERAYYRLKRLNEFGQELTALLDLNQINKMIFSYVSSLVDTSVFGIGIYNKEKNCIDFNSLIENNITLPSFSSSLDDTTSCAVWCFSRNKQILSNDFESDYKNFINKLNIRSSKIPLSVIYVPFSVKNKKTGILTVQSYNRNAYNTNDLNTLQTLASYLAIALDNANAYSIVNVQNKELGDHRSHLEKLVNERTKDLEEAKEKAEESDRLKSAFLANMSHEIRTPLNAIIGFTDLIIEDDFSDYNKEDMKQIIQQNSNSLLNLINDIIDFSKIEAGEISLFKTEVDAYELLTKLFQIYSEEIKRQKKADKVKIELDHSFSEQKINFLTDSIRLKQIFINLIDNAVKYTENGYVKLGIENIDNSYITFYIKDTGIGIESKNFDVIFERFRKIENKSHLKLYRGTGLGLSITKYLIEKLGGTIWLNSEINKGSVFSFKLPLEQVKKENDKKKSETKQLELDAPDWTEKLLLIVEDEESNFIVLKTILRKTNINIIWARDGKEAVEVYNEMNKKLDIVLLDIKLPRMNGIEVAKEMKKSNSKIPIIAQTAYALPEEENKIRSADFDDYISKPINKFHLFRILNNHIL